MELRLPPLQTHTTDLTTGHSNVAAARLTSACLCALTKASPAALTHCVSSQNTESWDLQAGTCFGMSAAACRTGFLLSQNSGSFLWVPLGIGFSALLTSSGFLIQTRGLKDGNTVIICTCAAVASMVSGQHSSCLCMHTYHRRYCLMLHTMAPMLVLLSIAAMSP